MAMTKNRRDVRFRALLATSVLVLIGGALIAWLPAKWRGSVADGTPEERVAHVREKAEAEIEQRFNEGVAMLNKGQYEQALKMFHRVLELSPSMPEAHVNAGFALLGQQRYDVARDFFEGAIDLRKNQLNAYYGLAEALAGMGDLPGALGAMRTYLHLAPPLDPYRAKAEAAVKKWEAHMLVMKRPGQGESVAAMRKNQDHERLDKADSRQVQ